MNNIKWVIVTSLINLFVITGVTAQSTIRLENWNFIKGYIAIDAEPTNWEPITVPHSWNAIDGQDGGSYYRGPGCYQRQLEIEKQTNEMRYFLRFSAVGTSADVYLNKQKIASHAGGYTAFATEITKQVSTGGTFDLRVLADNSYRDYIAPLSGDFTVAGGMHKQAELISKNAICFSLLDHASSGVYLYQENVSDNKASI